MDWCHAGDKPLSEPMMALFTHAYMHRSASMSLHYDDLIMTMLASQITSLTVVYSIVYSGVNQRKHQSSASLAFVREIHRGPVNFPHKWPITRKMFPFDDVIMLSVVMHNGETTWSSCHNDNLLVSPVISQVQNQIWWPKFWLPRLVTVCAWVTKINSKHYFSVSTLS